MLAVDGETATVQAGAVTVKVPVQALARSAARHPGPLPRGEGERTSPPQGQTGRVEGARIATPGKSAVAGSST